MPARSISCHRSHSFGRLPCSRPAAHDHLLHQVVIGKESVDQLRLFLALLGKLREAPRRGVREDRALDEPSVKLVTCEKPLHVGEEGLCSNQGV